MVARMWPAEIAVGDVVAALDTPEIRVHRLGAPARVASQVGDVLPVRIMRADGDQCIVRRAAAQGARSRVPDAELAAHFDCLGITPLLLLVLIVVDDVIPAHRYVLRCLREEGWH